MESFEVKWGKSTLASPTVPKLRLEFKARFKDDAQHDPARAEFRQNVSSSFKITGGPHKDFTREQEMHDDGYSRAADPGNYHGVNFKGNDNPGIEHGTTIDADDVVDYSFTAEQKIIDMQGGTEVAKLGPHTATITGKGERTYGGVPATLHR